jgi:hypothetical protein
MRSIQCVGTFNGLPPPKVSAASESATAHNNIRRIKPLMQCTALAIGGHDGAFLLVATADQFEHQIGVAIGVG